MNATFMLPPTVQGPAAAPAPCPRRARIDRLRDLVSSGQYHVPVELLAARIVASGDLGPPFLD